MAASRRLILDILARDRGAKRTIEGVADAAEDASRDLSRMGSSARRLDTDLDSTRGQMRALAAEMARLDRGSSRFAELRKQFNALSRDAGQMSKLRRALGDVVEEGGKVGLRLGQAISDALTPQVKAAIGGALIPAAAAAAPVLVGVLSAAVSAGLGAAGVAAGIKLAARDPRVAGAGKILGQELMSGLAQHAQVFVKPTLAAIKTIRAEFAAAGGDLRGIFTAAARYVEPLTRGLTGMVRNLLPGLRQAMGNAEPVIRMLADAMPRLGSALGRFMSDVTAEGRNAAAALDTMLRTTEAFIVGSGRMIRAVTSVYDEMVRGALRAAKAIDEVVPDWHPSSWLPGGIKDSIAELEGQIRSLDGAAAGSSNRLDDVGGSLSNLGGAWGAAHAKQVMLNMSMRDGIAAAGGLAEAMGILTGQALEGREAESAYQEAVDNLSAAFRANGATLNLNTAAGRANNTALQQLITTSQRRMDQTYQSIAATKGEAAAETAVRGQFNQTREALIAYARQTGMNEREARRFIDTLYRIPTSRTARVNLRGVPEALRGLAAVDSRLASLSGRAADVYIREHYITIDGRGQRLSGRAKGGPVSAGQPYIVGEEGPELVVPGQSGTVIPARQTRRLMDGANGARGVSTGGGVGTIVLGGDREIATLIRRLIRTTSGLNVVVA